MEFIDTYAFIIGDDIKRNRVTCLTETCGKIIISRRWFFKVEPSLLSFLNIRMIGQEVYSVELLINLNFFYPGLIQLVCLLLDIFIKEGMDEAIIYFNALKGLKLIENNINSEKEFNKKLFLILKNFINSFQEAQISFIESSFSSIEKKIILSYILSCVKLQQPSWTEVAKVENLITYIEKYEI